MLGVDVMMNGSRKDDPDQYYSATVDEADTIFVKPSFHPVNALMPVLSNTMLSVLAGMSIAAIIGLIVPCMAM